MLSIVIVNYNSGGFLQDCVASVLEQSDEVLVVDNASSDDSMNRLETSFSCELKLRIIRNTTNLGFAAACNAGMREARGDRIFFLNPDCRLESNAASVMLNVLNASDENGMVGGFLSNPDGSEQPGGRRAVPTPWRSFVRAFGFTRFSRRWPKLFFNYYLHELPLPSHPAEVEAISGACMMVKREVVENVGLWDEAYFLHCEDLDWCMRFRQKGWKIIFIPSARVYHAAGACSAARPVFVEWHKHKGMMRFYGKFFHHQYPAVFFWLVGAGVWLRFSALVIYYSVIRLKQRLSRGHT